ncbi:hypothetical protein CYMTET_52725 [Cymbomonas tetramitiformis]|uniref:Uncharacterized protein n=1 Tax=Cymbomonas tetramitiformis TaxID=36881 RepID=A0AAE0ERB8_9CHLO|nr:hypothetical protein CYMTET_52725 [Cymbomonas tetramitiformis]
MYYFFVLNVAKEGVLVADVDKRKEFYQKYGISCKGKFLTGTEFSSYCHRLGFIKDVIESAKAKFASLMGWTKYPDWYEHAEAIRDVYDDDEDTH